MAPSTADEDDGIHGPTLIAAGPVAPERVRFPGREHGLDALPPFGGDPPLTPHLPLVITHGSGSRGRDVFPHRIPEK